MRGVRSNVAIAACGLAGLLTPPTAAAVDACDPAPEVKVLYTGEGVLESVGVDRRGRLFFTDSTAGKLIMLARPRAEPKTILEGVEGPGGIIFRKDGRLLMGFGSSLGGGATGNLDPQARLMIVDPRTGETKIHTEGLQMANGIARGPQRTIFASVDFGDGIDRIQAGEVEVDWARLLSPNGLVVDSTGTYLFAAQTLTLAAIQRIPLDDPGAAATYYAAAPLDLAAGFDGMTRDGQDRLYVAANGSGEVWRVDGPGMACSLLSRDPFPSGPSDVAFGRPDGPFPRSSLYVTTFGGELLELSGAR